MSNDQNQKMVLRFWSLLPNNQLHPSLDGSGRRCRHRTRPRSSRTPWATAADPRAAGARSSPSGPGTRSVGTGIVDAVAPRIARPALGLVRRFLLTPEQGAHAALHLATAPELAEAPPAVRGALVHGGGELRPGRRTPSRVWIVARAALHELDDLLERGGPPLAVAAGSAVGRSPRPLRRPGRLSSVRAVG